MNYLYNVSRLLWNNHRLALVFFVVSNFFALYVFFDAISHTTFKPALIIFSLNANVVFIFLMSAFIFRDEVNYLYKEGLLEVLHGLKVGTVLLTTLSVLPTFIGMVLPLAIVQTRIPFELLSMLWINLLVALLAILSIRGGFISPKRFIPIFFILVGGLGLFFYNDGVKDVVRENPLSVIMVIIPLLITTFFLQTTKVK